MKRLLAMALLAAALVSAPAQAYVPSAGLIDTGGVPKCLGFTGAWDSVELASEACGIDWNNRANKVSAGINANDCVTFWTGGSWTGTSYTLAGPRSLADYVTPPAAMVNTISSLKANGDWVVVAGHGATCVFP